MKIAYFDCFSGISGDMCLGALVDAGASLREIEHKLSALPIKGYKLESKKVKRASIAATQVNVVVLNQASETRKWKDVEKMIRVSSLPERTKQKGLRIFRQLFVAEGKVHGEICHKAHLHELSAVDCIVDIIGTLIALELLGVERVFSSAVNLGSGSVMTAHGRLPVPAPATAELMKGIPVYSSDVPFELTTPTGAAILSGVTERFVPLPLVKIEKTGHGAGQKDLLGTPNILRIFLGEEMFPKSSKDLNRITVVETNIDDMNPQVYEYVMKRLFDSGALDVTLTQVIMKKGRPGIVLTALCHEERRADIVDIIFRETTTIGVRFYEAQRTALKREIGQINTEFGKVRVKRSSMPDGTLKLSPEYEDCKRTARDKGKSLLETLRQVESLLNEKKDMTGIRRNDPKP